jgi:ATP-binding protein involved in chromosome partitioning
MEEKTCPSAELFFKREFKKHTGIKDIRFVLAVGSGKGGVGKTTVSAILALALKKAGYLVGAFDLDFYGPNLHLVLGVNKKPMIEFGKIKPVSSDNIKILSLALMIAEKEPIFMRGLMASKLLQELLQKVEWGPLDFLILDLPPGTGDIFLTMLDFFNPEGFILITTPHKLALSDAKRTLSILREKMVPILGVVKNMADFFEDETSFQDFLNEQKLNVLFEIPVLKELSKTENLTEIFESSEKQKFLETIAERVLDKVFRIK